jgi:hypothetical protein
LWLALLLRSPILLKSSLVARVAFILLWTQGSPLFELFCMPEWANAICSKLNCCSRIWNYVVGDCEVMMTATL